MVFVVDVNTANIWKGKSKTLQGFTKLSYKVMRIERRYNSVNVRRLPAGYCESAIEG